jgi:hypothetical protein
MSSLILRAFHNPRPAFFVAATLLGGWVGFHSGADGCTGTGCSEGCYTPSHYHTGSFPSISHWFASVPPAMVGCSQNNLGGTPATTASTRIYGSNGAIVCPRNTSVFSGEDSNGDTLTGGLDTMVFTVCAAGGS